MKLCMIGAGYVGLVSGVCFSDLGNDVICVDKDVKKISKYLGLFLKAKKEMDIDLNESWMIGDSTSDILAANNLGMKNILINTGLAGRDYKYAIAPDYVFFEENVVLLSIEKFYWNIFFQ